MPAISARQITKQHMQKPRASAPTKKRRLVKRRGRARDGLDSDDEIERELATDESDSEDDDSDSIDSATDDSETEPVSEGAISHDRAHLPTPRNSKSPESVVKGNASPFFAPTGSWSEMVMHEDVDGSAELPVVDFADFGAPALPTNNKSTRKPKKVLKASSLPPRATPEEPVEQPPTPPADSKPTTPPATESKRIPYNRRQTLPSHSARQLYQQKLDSDPSFVPTIGNFWSHDDRLIDMELRNLSGWWRGRGRGGRGRGDYHIRGRGGFHGMPDNPAIEEEEVPLVDRPWTHDGFEEMKKKDEQRRAGQVAVRQAQSSPKRGGFAGRGRGNFMQGRGRGGYTRGFSSPARSRNDSPLASGNRVHFAMKPELMWTKQHEAFLYFDSSLKSRPGQAPGFRVKLPGRELQVIQISSSVSVALRCLSKMPATDQIDSYVVRLPKPVQEEKDLDIPDIAGNTDEASKSTSTDQDLEEPGPSSIDTDSISSEPQEVIEANVRSETITVESTPLVSEEPKEQPTTPLNASVNDLPVSPPVYERPALPPLQTTFTPPPPPPPPLQPVVSQPSPAYASTFGYALPLPPGIAMSAHGVPYEIATGQPVYLQPPTMFTPRPMMHSHYIHPGHMHHHSLSNASPDFLAPASHTPPINGFIDPTTGTPIFSFPRQTSRIEIRAPGETPSPAGAKVMTKPSPPLTSSLRSSSASFQPASARLNTESSDNSGYYLPSSTPSDPTMEDPAAASSVMQPYYPQQYYYPEPYGYSQYMDMSHAGQAYHMYGMEQAPQGTVYY